MKSDVHLGDQFGSLGRKLFQDGYDEDSQKRPRISITLMLGLLCCVIFFPPDGSWFRGKWDPGRCVWLVSKGKICSFLPLDLSQANHHVGVSKNNGTPKSSICS